MSRRFALLVNPAAAGGKALTILPKVTAELERREAEFRVVETTSLEHAAEEARAASAAGEVVAGLGGDGTVGRLAGALRGTDTALAVLPGGRGNDFARVLGIPTDPREAAQVAIDGEERLFDVAEVNGAPFVGIASLGFDSDANRIANEVKLPLGNLVYVYAAVRALAAWKPATFTVTIDGAERSLTGYSVAVANSKAFGGGMFLVPHAELDDGLLDVFMSGAAPKLKFLRDLPKVFKGAHVNEPSVSFATGREVEVRADRPFTVYADGDPIAELPARVRLGHRVLRVIVPC